jgi:hypothetical protein
MTSIESIKLSEVLRLVPKPKYVLGTTYTLSLAFFESVVFPEFHRSRLKSCLIICDSLGYHNALTEASALQGAAQDYMVVRAPVSGSFHPKVWLVVGEDEFALLVGSGNLTQAGFMTNAEMFDALHFKPDSSPSSDLLADIRAFLTGLVDLWPSGDHQQFLCVETLNQLDKALGAMTVARDPQPDGPRFLHSFQGKLIDQLPTTGNAKELFIASPYFGDSLQGLDLLAQRYPTARLNLFPAIHADNTTNIPLDQLRKSRKNAQVSPIAVPEKDKAFAHLKLYGVTNSDDSAWIYCTSANCTNAAWQGPNIEAGLWRKVAPSLVRQLFVRADADLPPHRLQVRLPHQDSNTLHCWATDTSEGLELQMSGEDRSRFPLHDVALTVRAGSNIAISHVPLLFQETNHTHLPWTAFAAWVRRRKAAMCLDLQAEDSSGQTVHASCLVENRLLLSADPTHRSAWRGAQALLDAEGAPELGDVAAIFSMANDVFGVKLLPLPGAKTPSVASTQHDAADNIPPGVAVWPPQPGTHELHRRMSSTALGQLKWFQHILTAFLRNPASGDSPHEPNHTFANHQADEQDDYEKKPAPDRGKNEDLATKRAQQLWDSAYWDYQRLRDRLLELCPTADNAPNIWPAAVFAFLSIMAVFRSAKRAAPDLTTHTGLSAAILCDDFFRAMFNPRQQGEDFCCPRSLRYRQEKFPSLISDLFFAFKVRLHPDLAFVVLALAIDRHTRNSIFKDSQALTKHQLEMVCDQAFLPDADTRDTCRRIWRRYMCFESTKVTDADFDRDFGALLNHNAPSAP